MYSMKNVPTWASKKSEAVQRVAIEVFNQTMKDTGSEEKARIASLAAMKNAEESFKKDKVKKSVEDIMKAKYLPADKE
jgi:3-methyladenine DNA glycosylase AlkC